MGLLQDRSRQFAIIACLSAIWPSIVLADRNGAQGSFGPFTHEQAEKGEVVFNDYCAECHRPDLTGALGPSLIDQAFKTRWEGKPVADLRDWVRANMPPNAPGTLPDQQLDPIVAWILFRNGVPPGSQPLDDQTAKSPFSK